MFAGLPTNPFAVKNENQNQEDTDDIKLKMKGLNKCFVESAKKLYEISPEADFTKLFNQYSQHLASFSVSLNKVHVPAATSEVSTSNFSKNVPMESKEGFEPVNLVESPKVIEQVSSFDSFKPMHMDTPIESFETAAFKILLPPPFLGFKTSGTKTETPASTEPLTSNSFASTKDSNTCVDKSETTAKVESNSIATKPFSFNSLKPVESTTAPISTAAIDNGPTAFKPFSFGSSSTLTAEAPKVDSFDTKLPATTAPAAFSFDAKSSATTAPSTFSFDAKSPATTAPSAFSLDAKPTATTAPVAISFDEKSPVTAAPSAFSFDTKSPVTTAPAAFSFGSTSTTAADNGPLAFKPFSFGASSTTTTDQPSGTTEAPKFSFGSTTSTTLPTFSFGSSGGFAFNVPSASATTSKADQSCGEDDEIPAEEAESFNIKRSNSEQFKTGAGEENESSLHEERCKVFMMDMNPESSSGGWIDLGVGIFKINRYNNETGKSRILCRTEGNGKVILNTLISVPGMDVSSMEGKKEVALLAFGPDGKPTKYLIRVKTVEQAINLKSAILSEIEHVKSNKK